ncbi:MAG: AAA family ATPase [Phycisphaeraceae bacterium]
MLTQIDFQNFKALQNTSLPLQRLTLLVGPNGSGKSTALAALRCAQDKNVPFDRFRTIGVPATDPVSISFKFHIDSVDVSKRIESASPNKPTADRFHFETNDDRARTTQQKRIEEFFSSVRFFRLSAARIAQPVVVPKGAVELMEDGRNLAGVLIALREDHPGRFASAESELRSWLPEYEGINFDRNQGQEGQLAIKLRRPNGHGAIPANELSDGTLLALAMVTLGHLPNPPAFVCIEEPDHGIHPRLLRDVCMGLHRLAFPEEFGDSRAAVQVLITSHSPYMLDLFREHPERVVIAEKDEKQFRSTFKRLDTVPHFHDILGEASLGDAWYTGVFGGVPAAR